MVVALLALSLAVTLGGIAAVVQGFPYVRLESGLAMVIGGSTAASAGVILLGLTAILDRLRKIQGSLSARDAETLPARNEAAPAAAVPWDVTAPTAPVFPAPEVAPPERPSLAGLATATGAAGLAGLSLGALRPGGRGAEPVFEDPASSEPRAEAEPLLPDLLPDAAPEPNPARGAGGAEEDDLFGGAERRPPVFSVPEPAPVTVAPLTAEAPAELELPAPEPIGLRSSLEEPASAPEPDPVETPSAGPAFLDAPATEAAPAIEDAEANPEPAPEERHAVGSYSSGANTYVMFSDGSIEADTPRGRFTFASLDELKSFVNAGGEEARGAA